MLKSKELREQRMKLVADARLVLEKKELTAEDRSQYDKIMADADSIKADIERYERSESEEREAAKPISPVIEKKVADYRGAFYSYLRNGLENMDPEERTILKQGWQKIEGEERTAQSTSTTAGGYTVPQGFQAELEKNMVLYADVEQAARVLRTPRGNDIPWPTVDDTSNKGRLLAENAAITNTAVAFGQKTLKAYKFSSDSLLVSSELLQDSEFSDLDSILGELLGERIGRIKADYYTTGTGTSQPEGVVAGSSLGATAASATAITSDELIDLYHAIDPAYRKGPKVAWMFNDTTFKAARKLKNSTTGDYMWQPGMRVGEPDTLFGKPFFINQSMDSPATGKKVALFGDFSKYVVRNVNNVVVRRLNELYAANDQVGLIAFARSDARYVVGNATNPAVKHYVMA